MLNHYAICLRYFANELIQQIVEAKKMRSGKQKLHSKLRHTKEAQIKFSDFYESLCNCFFFFLNRRFAIFNFAYTNVFDSLALCVALLLILYFCFSHQTTNAIMNAFNLIHLNNCLLFSHFAKCTCL